MGGGILSSSLRLLHGWCVFVSFIHSFLSAPIVTALLCWQNKTSWNSCLTWRCGQNDFKHLLQRYICVPCGWKASNSSPCVITAQANNGLKGQNSTTESTVCLCLRKLNANCGKRGIWQVSLNERLEFWGGESQRIVAWISAMALKVKSVCICFNNEEQTMAELKKKKSDTFRTPIYRNLYC